MKSLIRYFALKFIRESMAHERSDDRKLVFAAINEGMRTQFYEDNSQTRLNFTVLNLVENGEEFHPYRHLGHTIHPDAISHAEAARDAVMEAMKDNELTEWRKDIIARENKA